MSRVREVAVASVFSALGDPTRLSLVHQLGAEGAMSATGLSEGSKVTRQAIAKHLHVLQGAGLVTHHRRGREVLYSLEAGRLRQAEQYLEHISARWDRALGRLRRLVEEP